MEALGNGSWILRKESFEIITALNQESSTTPKFLLHGSTGCGKSVCMSQVMQWCSRAGWIIVHVPNVFDWTHSCHELRPSPHNPNTYDQPQESVQWLKNFRTTNSQLLSQIKLTKAHEWTKRERSEVNDDLSKVIEVGLIKPNIATDVVAMVMKIVAEQQDKKIVLAVDSFNGCFNPTSLKLGKEEWVSPHQLNLLTALLENTTRAVYPGAVLLALSRTKMYRHSVCGYSPEKLLGEKGCVSVSDCQWMQVPNLEREEMDTWLTASYHNKWINREPTESVSSELWHLTSGNPAELSRLSRAL
ncbi:small ribosomal subunit protein mS29-like isoform X2 [Halichondria panicea]